MSTDQIAAPPVADLISGTYDRYLDWKEDTRGGEWVEPLYDEIRDMGEETIETLAKARQIVRCDVPDLLDALRASQDRERRAGAAALRAAADVCVHLGGTQSTAAWLRDRAEHVESGEALA